MTFAGAATAGARSGTDDEPDRGGASESAAPPRPPQPVAPAPVEATPRLVWRLRLVAVVVGLAAICFRQSPGLVVPDTKLDLTADPGGFLLRALHLWDPQGALGQLQNQAYGYLFPVGPFHLVLNAVGVPGWVVQRLWWTTVMTVALLGMWRLSRAFGVTNPWARLVAAVSFALCPRILSEVAITSVEVWPLALSPWVLWPLVESDRSVRWRATRSGFAFAFVGGINAVASGAALVLPALWLLTRRRDRALLRLAAAWTGAIALVSAWWVAPLLLLGRYSPPFLSWIEDAATTTGTASPFEALRGTSPWLGFLATPTGPSWPVGWLYVTAPLLIVATAVTAGLGLVGLALRGGRERSFLLLGLVVGLALVTLGHGGSGGWPWNASARSLLDGALAPLRNTHKFELVVRVPLAIGLGHVVGRGMELFVSSRLPVPAPVRRLLPAVVATSLVVMAAAPAVGVSFARPEGYRAIPDHWRQAAAWLDAQPAEGAVLVTPSAGFSDLTWGSTKDEPLQALAGRPFVVRDAVPLGSAGATRLLDSLEDRLSSGEPVPGLTTVLANAGIAYVLVRNEIRLDVQGAPPAAVTSALESSGLSRVASFGPNAGAYGESDTLTVDYRALVQRPAIEVYAVPRPSVARMVPASSLSRVAGGPENLLQLASAGGARDALLGTDRMPASAVDTAGTAPEAESSAVSAARVLTDGQRRREIAFGRSADNTSGLLAAEDPGRTGRRVIDLDSDPAAPRTVLRWNGVSSVTASSSAADADATLRIGAGAGPSAALDGDPRTRWVSGRYGSARGEWLDVRFQRPTAVAGTTITLSADAPVAAPPTVVRVDTDRGSATTAVFAGPAVPLLTPPGPTSHLRVTLVGVGRGAENGFAVQELTVPGVRPAPVAAMPSTGRAPDAVLLEEGRRSRSECLRLEGTSWCSPVYARQPEETGWSREWEATTGAVYAASGAVRALDGAALEKLLGLPSGARASASSRLVQAPAGRPDAALDGDPGTGWVASPDDPAPWFEVQLPEAREVTGLRLTKRFALPASTPVAVRVQVDGGRTVSGRADASGVVRFAPVRTRTLRITFGDVRLLVNIDSASSRRSFAPIGFSELSVLGAEDLLQPLPATAHTGVPCGFGPVLRVDGVARPTAVGGRVGDVLAGRPLTWRACSEGGRLDVPAGRVRVDATASAEFAPQRLDLLGAGFPRRAGARTDLAHSRPTAAELVVGVPGRSASSVVTVAQNFNAGWVGRTSTGELLAPVRVNGWQQGWVVPAGAATTLVAVFAPDRPYRLALVGGLLLLVAGLVLGLRPTRGRTRGDAGRALPDASRARPFVSMACLAVVALAGGWPGLAGALLAGAVFLGFRRAGRRSPGRGPRSWRRPVLAAAGTAPLAAALVVASDPWPSGRLGVGGPLVQLLVWLGVAAACLVVLVDDRPSRRLLTRRMTGRSTR